MHCIDYNMLIYSNDALARLKYKKSRSQKANAVSEPNGIILTIELEVKQINLNIFLYITYSSCTLFIFLSKQIKSDLFSQVVF